MPDKKRNPQLLKPLITVTVFCAGLALLDFLVGGANYEVLGIGLLNLYVTLVVFCIALYLFQFGFYSENKAVQNLSLAAFSTLFFLGITVFLLEKICGYLLLEQEKKAPSFVLDNKTYPKLDGALGIRSHGPQNGFSTLSQGADTIFHVRLHTDENGFRITPPAADDPDRHALFLGCSFTWGSAVDSAETYAALFAQSKPEFKGYNFGQGGWGPHTSVSLMMFKPLEKWVAEPRGLAVYTLIDDQIPRIDNELWHYEQIAGGNQPYFTVADGEPEYKGLFSEALPVRNWIFKNILTKSKTMKYFRIGVPMRMGPADYRKAAELLAYVQRKYKERFQDSPFYVLLYPGADREGTLLEALRAQGLSVLDYRQLFDPEAEAYKTRFDGHPTPRANREIVSQLLKDIDLSE